ncbi:metal-dependent hydrolase [Haloferax mediterranei ATCC 33500]|uniref:Metal-dependent hydrolase n=1 Tax=Haloferax mediterranei (strain ATCC 33500 / DSM 1411 / JCM 8866 / NBRC 14739 / NCIMB 2177 / R-4) TaxID=523841 RepID=I3R3Z1_HALMT|nr:metal-dependent hydrolase [Haloferax mediterranei]AFK18951.1 putative membrane-bound metal-dependent hydrolase [Haloferax mediterranei ATCC 33500]AHZ21687.1 metal-dependent hydrolase [Haloferax mediterranei ATCC 33500]EMA03190.1 putative membrane-bound metal-dependent hydrolase [Haloferax mediterranei ATCC 33500]MDX5989043.1 metal-dependent hydrolase [Haloferax mediterranei ATCC 33500]QCQ75436.1 metal-dependent hydrolase [Haloferax mediterranei ATCC 33500]
MFRFGHWGVSLLVFAPLGFALVQTGHPELAFVSGAVMCWLAMLPDYDMRIPGISHRGPTHTLLFAFLVGGVGGGGAFLLASNVGQPEAAATTLGAFGFAVGTLTIIAHLLADALTPAGIRPLWPLSSRKFTLSLWTADNTVANYGLFAVGVFAVAAAAYLSLIL